MTTTTRICDYEVNEDTHNLFEVTLDYDQIQTLVTDTPHMVDFWLNDIYRIHRHRLHRLIVGLDVEWRPSFNRYIENPVATLQLCVGRRYLVFQLIHISYCPDSVIEFLERFTFVGVGIESDVKKLLEDYGLKVANVVDLCGLAAKNIENVLLRKAGLKGLARVVLGKKIDKPSSVTLSRWCRKI